MSSTLEHDPRALQAAGGLRGWLTDYKQRISQGDVGYLPVFVSLILIAVIFQYANGNFLKPFNLVNLTFQMASVGMISVGVVLILLLGEIDLSVGIMSGIGAAVMAVLSEKMGISGSTAILLGILTGTALGLFQGAWINFFGVPSFIVTLSGLLAIGGGVLLVLGKTGSLNLTIASTRELANTFYRGPAAYLIAILFVAYVAGTPLVEQWRRRAAGLSTPPLSFVVVRAILVTIVGVGAVPILEKDRGVSSALVYLLALVVVMDYTLRRTRFGRMIYAIGGNAEAARRAGIPVKRIRTVAFALASSCAACGGILGASRLYAVNQSVGGGDVLVNSIAAVVIGGTSLFGGRGSVWSALLGIIVITSIANGMNLLQFQPATKYVITGAVLLTTVTLDAVLRRGKAATR